MTKILNLTIALIMVLGLMSLAPAPASAASFTSTAMYPGGAANPTTVGSTVTVAGGSSVPGPGKPITIYLAKSPGAKTWITPADDGDVVASTTSDAATNWGDSFTVPERRGGTYDVFLQSVADSFTFTGATGLVVRANLEKNAGSGAPGSTVNLKGTGFATWESGITVIFDTAIGGLNKTVASGITANSNGTWTGSGRVPDRAAASSLIISAVGDSGTNVTTTFSVVRRLQLFPSRASPGGTVYMLGRGFAVSSAITSKLDATTLTTSPAAVTSNATGLFIASFTVPATGIPFGAHEITATDTASGAATAQLTVIRPASITLTPKYGIPGDTITIVGSGFNGAASMNISFDGTSFMSNQPGVVTIADGSFTASFVVPELTESGYYAISATDSLNESASASFTVQQSPTQVQVVAETAIGQGVTGDAGRYVYISSSIARFFDQNTMNTVTLPDGIGAFDAYMSYTAGGLNMKGYSGVAPFSSPTVTLDTMGGTRSTVNASQTGSTPQPPLELIRFYPWLIGSKNVPITITLHYNTITRSGGVQVPQNADVSKTFVRGDANSNGNVTIADALFIAQYLAGIRELGETGITVNPLNAATARNDSATSGSSITIADALFIAQMLAGLRDNSYNLF